MSPHQKNETEPAKQQCGDQQTEQQRAGDAERGVDDGRERALDERGHSRAEDEAAARLVERLGETREDPLRQRGVVLRPLEPRLPLREHRVDDDEEEIEIDDFEEEEESEVEDDTTDVEEPLEDEELDLDDEEDMDDLAIVDEEEIDI